MQSENGFCVVLYERYLQTISKEKKMEIQTQYSLEQEATLLFSFYKQYLNRGFLVFEKNMNSLAVHYDPNFVKVLTEYKSILEIRLIMSGKKNQSDPKFRLAKDVKVLIRSQRKGMRPYLVWDESELDALIGVETESKENPYYNTINEKEREILARQDQAMRQVLEYLDKWSHFDKEVFDVGVV